MAQRQTIQNVPSILSADFARLGEQVREAEEGGAGRIHVDVMDGHFVPNITVGPLVIEALRPHTSVFIEAHLMIERPELFIPQFAQTGADLIIVHVETCPHLHRTIQQIKELGKAAGVDCSPAAVFRALDRLGITRKKNAPGGRTGPPRAEGRAGGMAAGVRRHRPVPAGLRR